MKMQECCSSTIKQYEQRVWPIEGQTLVRCDCKRVWKWWADYKKWGVDGPYPDCTWEEYDIGQTVARWILDGKKNIDKPETQQWLIDNGFGHLIPK